MQCAFEHDYSPSNFVTMKILSTLGILQLTFWTAFAQQATAPKLDANSTKAYFGSHGVLLTDHYNVNSGLTIHDALTNNDVGILYNIAFWFGAMHNDTIRLVAERQAYANEYSKGPVSFNNSYSKEAYISKYWNPVWKVSKEEIIYHIDNYNQPGYQAPYGIQNWPANGDAELGIAHDLAPYIDVNSDGIYNPYDGDYPCIRGDQAGYIILNDDDKPHNSSGGQKLGIELHIMLYQYSTNDFIDSTTFINLKVINRSDRNYTSFKAGLFADFDIGNPNDDRISCFPDRNAMIGFNADNFDEPVPQSNHFGENPPASGIMSLNHNMIYAGRDIIGFQLTSYAWHNMNGYFGPNSPMVEETGLIQDPTQPYTTTNFGVDNNPFYNQGIHDNYYSILDRKGFMVMDSVVLNSGQTHEYDYVFLFDRRADNITNIYGLWNRMGIIQELYDNQDFDFGCEQEGTGNSDSFEIVDWSQQMVEIKRLDGCGNMGFFQELTPECSTEILANNMVDFPTYQKGKGPIHVKVEDLGNHALGRFELKFRDYGSSTNAINNASWTVYRYDLQTNMLLDSVNSESAISFGTLQYIPEWGISVRVKQQYNYLPPNHFAQQHECTVPLEVQMEIPENGVQWLSAVKDLNAEHAQNWSLGFGDYIVPNNSCYKQHVRDTKFGDWDGLWEGGVSHFSLLRNCHWYSPVTNNPDLIVNQAQESARIASTNGVDLVITPDKNLWTRSAVVETCNWFNVSQGGAYPMKRRNNPSVDKNGLSPSDSGFNLEEGTAANISGMGWFPGYAIDIETGRRLNIVFGENSCFPEANGADMIWNPNSINYDDQGYPVFAGSHLVFVLGENIGNSGMPIYDSCKTFLQGINSNVPNQNRNAWQNATWVLYPRLNEGFNLLENELTLKMRVVKRFENFTLTGQNAAKPMFEWDISEVLPIDLSTDNHIEPQLIIYPNPTNSEVTVSWNNYTPQSIQIYSITGQLLQEIKTTDNQNFQNINLKDNTSGVYILKIGDLIRRVILE